MRRRPSRSENGAVLPLVGMAALFLLATLAFAIDINRNIAAVQKLQFAAESAALDAYAQLLNRDGTMPGDGGFNNAQNAVSVSHGASPWNTAPLGPANKAAGGPFDGGVTIQNGDVNFVTNPSDAGERLLQVTARRSGAEALQYFFIPVIHAIDIMNGGSVPAQAQSASPYRTVEVIGAPASRIGKGAPRNVATRSSTSGWATFPLAISYSQYQTATNPARGAATYVIDLLTSKAPFNGAVPANHIRGALVNVVASGGSGSYYGIGQGNPAISELIASLRYFSPTVSANETAPGIVERGSQLAVFDSGAPNFTNRMNEFKQPLLNLQPGTGRYFIVPVVNSDPVINSRSTVVGFALMRLDGAWDAANGRVSFQFSTGPSMPVRNAASSMVASVPAVTGTQLPPPPATGPFANRAFNPASNTVSPRYLGVAYAPVTSPRAL